MWAIPNDVWNEFTDEEKNDYLIILEHACRNAPVDQKVFARMSKRVLRAAEQFYTSHLKAMTKT